MCDNVLLTFDTDSKIECIKELRQLTGFGLKDAKDALEQGLVTPCAHVGTVVNALHSLVQRRNTERNAHWQSAGRIYEKPVTLTLSIQVLPWEPKPQPVRWEGPASSWKV